MQLFADIYELEIQKTNIGQEAASLGAAALALKGTGLWNSYEKIDTLHQEQQRFRPDPVIRQPTGKSSTTSRHLPTVLLP